MESILTTVNKRGLFYSYLPYGEFNVKGQMVNLLRLKCELWSEILGAALPFIQELSPTFTKHALTVCVWRYCQKIQIAVNIYLYIAVIHKIGLFFYMKGNQKIDDSWLWLSFTHNSCVYNCIDNYWSKPAAILVAIPITSSCTCTYFARSNWILDP